MSPDRRDVTKLDLYPEMDLKTRERIHHPVVRELYEAYVREGIYDELITLVDRIPTSVISSS